MKRLDKYQVKALAGEIVNKGKTERTKQEDLLRKDKKLLKQVDDVYKIIEKIPTSVRRKLYWDDSQRETKARILNALLDTSSLPKVKSQSSIENEIIIASIDADDMNQIVKSINAFE